MGATEQIIKDGPQNKMEVYHLIDESDEHAIGALIRLYSLQTNEERNAQATIEDNGVGFNGVDSGFLSNVAEFYLSHKFLTPNQLTAVRKSIKKYYNQLLANKFEPLPIKGKTPKRTAPVKRIKWAGIGNEGKRIVVKFQFPKGDDSFQETLAQVKTLPGRRWVPEQKIWTLPVSVEAAEKLQEYEFEIAAGLQEWISKMTTAAQSYEVEVPDLRLDLYPFQKAGVGFLEDRHGSAIIGDEMGLGKTAQALAYLQLHPEIRPAVIVCPASVKFHWANKIEEWMTPQNLFVLNGVPKEGNTDLWNIEYKMHQVSQADRAGAGEIILVNYDILANQTKKEKTGKIDPQTRKEKTKTVEIPRTGWADTILSLNPKTIILDECHYIKNSKALRTKAIFKIAMKTDGVIGLSGTPIINRPVEFFNIIELCRPGLFANFWDFAQTYCGAKNNGYGWDFTGATKTKELNKLLTKHVMVRRKKADVLKDLPPKTRAVIPVDLDPGNRRQYDRAKGDIIKWIRENIGEGDAESATKAEALVEFEKLKQIAADGKMKASISWIDNFIESGEKLVVFCTHTKTVDLLKAHFKEKAVRLYGSTSHKKREKAVDRFQHDSNVRVFIGNIKAAGVGITLTAASNTCFVELGWSPGEHAQAEDRVHRIGQESDAVTAWYLVAQDTVEEEIADLIDSKQAVLDAVLDGTDVDSSNVLTDLLNQYKEKGEMNHA